MTISVASRKAKARRLQNFVRDEFRQVLSKYGCVDDDCWAVPMGQAGVDVVFSPRAKAVHPFLIECKAQEALNVVNEFLHHLDTYASQEGLKMLIHSKSRTEPLVTLRWADFRPLLESFLVRRSEEKEAT